MRLDLLVSGPGAGGCLAVELKYLTAAWSGEDDGEQFTLLGQGAQDIRAYDVVKDVKRVEQLVDLHPGWRGLVLVLANDPAYWSRPAHGLATNADAFRIYEGQELAGKRAWGPLTGAGTMKDRTSPIELRGSYLCHWAEYSSLPGSRGTFRLLALAVSAGEAADQAPTAGRRPGQQETRAQPGPGHGRQGQSAQPVPGDQADPYVTRRQGTAPGPGDQHYSVSDLRGELLRFEHELREAGFAGNSVQTYVDRTRRFLRWLEGDYQPRTTNLRCLPPL